MTVNEFLVSLYLYTYTLLSDNTSDYNKLQDIAGLIQVSIVFIAIIINAIFAFGSISIYVFRRIKKICAKKAYKEVKQLDKEININNQDENYCYILQNDVPILSGTSQLPNLK
jgi:hypothetical protein